MHFLNLVCAFSLATSCADSQYATRADGTSDVPDLATIDIITPDGTKGSLAKHVGKVVVLDVCAASFDGCLINANMVAHACKEVCDDDIVMISMLIDDGVFRERAVSSYLEVLKVPQQVVSPGAAARAGTSALGALAVPQLLIFGRDGNVTEAVAGAAISPVALTERVLRLKGDSTDVQ